MKFGFCVYPDFLSRQTLLETRKDVEEIDSSGGFRRAGVGQGINVQDLAISILGFFISLRVRRDQICWLDRDLANTDSFTDIDPIGGTMRSFQVQSRG